MDFCEDLYLYKPYNPIPVTEQNNNVNARCSLIKDLKESKEILEINSMLLIDDDAIKNDNKEHFIILFMNFFFLISYIEAIMNKSVILVNFILELSEN